MKYILALLFAMVVTPVFAQGKTINQLNPGAPLTGTELMPMFQGGNPAVTTTPNAIKTFTNAGITSGSGTPGIISVTQAPYNAKCDETTDDTAAIQAAVIAAGSEVAPHSLQSIIIIPGLCAISSSIIVRQPATDTNLEIHCTGNEAGFFWIGADNTGPMIVLGDPTAAHQDGAFQINNCQFDGKDAGHKPNVAIRLSNSNNSRIRDVQIGGNAASNTYTGLDCVIQCLLLGVEHSNFACLLDCISMISISNNGADLRSNQFSYCGRWCYNSNNDNVVLFLNNYFEGDQIGSLGSINLVTSFGDKIIGNVFEDNNHAGMAAFRSVNVTTAQDLKFIGNYYIGAPDGDYRITLGVGGHSAVAEFYGEGNPIEGTSGSFIEQLTSNITIWHGGTGCNAATLFGGANGFRSILDHACATTDQGVSSFYSVDLGATAASGGIVRSSAFASANAAGPPQPSGACGMSTQRGNTIGSFVGTGNCVASNFTFTFSGLTMPFGYSCSFENITSPSNIISQSASTSTTVTAIANWSLNDVINYHCFGF